MIINVSYLSRDNPLACRSVAKLGIFYAGNFPVGNVICIDLAWYNVQIPPDWTLWNSPHFNGMVIGGWC